MVVNCLQDFKYASLIINLVIFREEKKKKYSKLFLGHVYDYREF